MNRHFWIIIVSWCVGCGDAELTVRFEVPPSYRADVASTALSIYASPIAAPFTCEDIAFGVADPDVLRASLVAEFVERGKDTTPLTDIDRVAPKVFVVVGNSEFGERIVAGCAEVNEVREDTEVVIQGQPVTETGTITDSIQQMLGRRLDDPVVLTITDVRGRPVAGADVRWRVEGSTGTSGAGRGTSDGMGRVSLQPELPPIAGPFILDVQVRWSGNATPPIPGFVVPAPDTLTLDGHIYDVRSGRVGPGGEPGIVALTSGELAASRRVVFVYRSAVGGELLRRISQSVPATSAKLGLLDGRGERDRAIIVTEDSWFEMTTDGAPLRSDAYEPPVGVLGRAPTAIYPAGSCADDGTGPQVIIGYDGNGAGIYEQNGLRLVTFTSRLDLLSAGCVAGQSGTDFRMLVINQANVGVVVAAELEPGFFLLREWFAVPSGMSFSPQVGTDKAMLLGTQLVVNDFVVSRLTMKRTGPEQFELVMGELDSPPAPPRRVRGGTIDGDKSLDVVSLFVRPRFFETDPVRYAIWAVLGRRHRGLRIAGDFDLPVANLIAPEMMLVDMDGDRVDDVVVVERPSSLTDPRSARVEIYSMGLLGSSAR